MTKLKPGEFFKSATQDFFHCYTYIERFFYICKKEFQFMAVGLHVRVRSSTCTRSRNCLDIFQKKRNCLDHKFITSLVCHRKKDFVGLIRHSVQQRAWGQGCKYLMVFSGQMINSDGIAALVYFSFTINYVKCILIHLIKIFYWLNDPKYFQVASLIRAAKLTRHYSEWHFIQNVLQFMMLC